jgi:hypothetical protein
MEDVDEDEVVVDVVDVVEAVAEEMEDMINLTRFRSSLKKTGPRD